MVSPDSPQILGRCYRFTITTTHILCSSIFTMYNTSIAKTCNIYSVLPDTHMRTFTFDKLLTSPLIIEDISGI